jgi:hypothetical protein
VGQVLGLMRHAQAIVCQCLSLPKVMQGQPSTSCAHPRAPSLPRSSLSAASKAADAAKP